MAAARRTALAAALLLLPLAAGRPAGAQADLDCPEFPSQAAAQENYRATFPDDPNDLDRNNNGVACENDIAKGTYADPTVDTQPLTDAPVAATAFPTQPAAGVGPTVTPDATRTTRSTSGAVSYRDALPRDVLARVDRCAAVAVSRRRVTGAGCADGRNVAYRQPRGEPDLLRTAVTRFVMPDWFDR